MAYVYRHIRLDKNEPFYIGIGSDSDGRHTRAYNSCHRKPHWKNIVAKTEYVVDILIDNVSLQEAIKKEIEFIALYKRVCDGGTLCNLTIGGEGTTGIIRSEETRKKQSLIKKGKPAWNKGIPMTPEHAAKFNATKKGRPSAYKGKKWTDELRARIMASRKPKFGADHHFFGKKHSEETRLKISVTKKLVYKNAKTQKPPISESEVSSLKPTFYALAKVVIAATVKFEKKMVSPVAEERTLL